MSVKESLSSRIDRLARECEGQQAKVKSFLPPMTLIYRLPPHGVAQI